MGNTFKLGNYVNALFQDASNNVGIGAAPSGSYKLEVTGTGRFTGALIGAGSTWSGNMTIQKTAPNILMKGGYAQDLAFFLNNEPSVYLVDDATATKGIKVNISTGAFTQLGSGASSFAGNVGIGMTNPAVKLDVTGEIRMTGAYLYMSGENSAINWQNAGVTKAYTAIITSGGGAFVNGSQVNDLLNRTNNSNQIWCVDGGSNIAMKLNTAGNLSIGDLGDANQRLRVVGSSTGTSAYGIVVANSTGASTMFVRNDGYGYLLASAWAYGSDLRIKENVSDVENGLDMVLKMKPKHFDYINGQKDNLGFIAQDIQEIIPQAVSISDETTGMLALKTDFLVPYLVKAIQELNERLNKAGL